MNTARIALAAALFFGTTRLAGANPSLASEEENAVKTYADVRHEFVVARPVDEVFALFDPIAEKDWVPGWDPQPVHPAELSLDEASVFTLDRAQGREVWTILRHDPRANVAEYLATTPNYQQRWITVECETIDGGTLVKVRYRVTALSSAGRNDLAEFDESFIRSWEAPVAKALGIH